MALEKLRQQTEMAKLDVDTQRLTLIREGKVPEAQSDDSRDILNSLRLVPKFNEEDVDTFFTLFERVAETRVWSNADRVVLLQCVLTGRGQEAFFLIFCAG